MARPLTAVPPPPSDYPLPSKGATTRQPKPTYPNTQHSTHPPLLSAQEMPPALAPTFLLSSKRRPLLSLHSSTPLSLVLLVLHRQEIKLHAAVRKNNLSGVHKALEDLPTNGSEKADVNAVADNDWTALQIAAWMGHTDVIRILLSKGADILAARDNGATAVYLAAEQGQDDAVRVLCDQGREICNLQMNRGATPLYVAAHNGHERTIRVLAKEFGADVNARTNNGAPRSDSASSTSPCSEAPLFATIRPSSHSHSQTHPPYPPPSPAPLVARGHPGLRRRGQRSLHRRQDPRRRVRRGRLGRNGGRGHAHLRGRLQRAHQSLPLPRQRLQGRRERAQ